MKRTSLHIPSLSNVVAYLINNFVQFNFHSNLHIIDFVQQLNKWYKDINKSTDVVNTHAPSDLCSRVLTICSNRLISLVPIHCSKPALNRVWSRQVSYSRKTNDANHAVNKGKCDLVLIGKLWSKMKKSRMSVCVNMYCFKTFCWVRALSW